MAKKKKRPAPICDECGQEYWSNTLGLCRACIVRVMDIQGTIRGLISLEDDEDVAPPGCWFPGIDGRGQGYLC